MKILGQTITLELNRTDAELIKKGLEELKIPWNTSCCPDWMQALKNLYSALSGFLR